MEPGAGYRKVANFARVTHSGSSGRKNAVCTFSVANVVARIPSRCRCLCTAVTDGKLFFRSVTLSVARDRESSSELFPSVLNGNVRRLALCRPVRAAARCSYRCFRSHFTRLLFALVYPSCMSRPTRGRRAPLFILRGKYYREMTPSSLVPFF